MKNILTFIIAILSNICYSQVDVNLILNHQYNGNQFMYSQNYQDENGNIIELIGEEQSHFADLYIDCTGFTKLLIEKIIEDFKFETPKNLPKICSLISGYFSYDSIRYIEKIPNKCKDDLKLPDVRLLRPRTLIIHDNLKKEIFFIRNIFQDEKINDYEERYEDIKNDLSKLIIQSPISYATSELKGVL